MIEIVEGKGVGAGKSYYVCERLIAHWRRGGTARISESFHVLWDPCKALVKKRYGLLLEDDQFRTVAPEDVSRLHEVTEAGSEDCPLLIILDESQDQLNARDWNDKGKRDLFAWCCQSRHDDNDLIFVSQSAANIDKQVRRLATFFWSIRNARNHSIPGFGNTAKLIRLATLGLNSGFYFVRTMLDYDGRTMLERHWVKADRELFKCYKSKSMQLARKRAGVVGKKNLKYEKGRSPMIKWVILAGILFGGYSAFKLFTGGSIFGGSGKDNIVSAAPAVPGGKSRDVPTGPKPEYEIQHERWFSQGGKGKSAWMKTVSGMYRVGTLSVHGFVEGILDDTIRVRRPDKTLLYIIGDGDNAPGTFRPAPAVAAVTSPPARAGSTPLIVGGGPAQTPMTRSW